MKDYAMSQLTDEEQQIVDEIQHKLGGIKRRLRRMRKVQDEAGRDSASNATYRLECQLGVWHADALKALQDNIDRDAGPTRRGGRT